MLARQVLRTWKLLMIPVVLSTVLLTAALGLRYGAEFFGLGTLGAVTGACVVSGLRAVSKQSNH